jgi:ribosomal protein L24
VVITGRDKGRSGEVIEVRPAAGARAGARHPHGQAPPEAVGDAGSGIVSKESSVHLSQSGAGRSEGRQADPRGFKMWATRRSASPSVGVEIDAEKKKEAEAEKAPRPGRPKGPNPKPKRAKARRRRRQAAAPKARASGAEGPRPAPHFDSVIRKKLPAVRLQEPMEVPRLDKIVLNMGVARRPRPQKVESPRRPVA